jgi:hypothetical protein
MGPHDRRKSRPWGACCDAACFIQGAQATQTALRRVPNGAVKSVELEREHGKLVWSFDVAQSGKSGVTEVQVDAVTGQVVSLKRESAAQEADEASAEAKGK